MALSKLRIWMLLTCLLVLLSTLPGCDSSSGGSSSIGPSPSPSPADPDSMAIFAWNDGDKKMFTQKVNGGNMGNELVYGTWGEHWESMTRYDIGGHQFIMGLQNDAGGRYFIQELLLTGDPGFTLEKGLLDGQFDMLRALTLPYDQVFVIANNANDENHEWAIWKILPGGNLGEKTDSGNWDRRNWTLTSVEFPEKTYLFGQSPKDDDCHWFLREVNSDGTLGTVTDQGQWHDWYPVARVVRKNDKTYLFGHTYDPNYWFLQEIYPSGKFGNHTDGGHWHQYYGSTATWEMDGKTYLFGHSDSNYRWFIQEILDGGKMAPDHTSYGYWHYFYEYVFPFNFSSAYLDVAHWMTDLYDEYLKDRKLSQISLPGSHDSGMYKHQHCTLGSYCNTVAQNKSIYEQLQAGARYFDIRPVWMEVQSEWFTGHWDFHDKDWLIGCAGVNLDTALMNVASFLKDGGERVKKELIILSFSHCYYNVLGATDHKCDDKKFGKLKQFIQDEMGDYLIKGDSNTDFADMKLKDIFALNGKQVIVIMHGAPADPENGIFGTHNLDIYNNYTNTENLTKMENDQIDKLLNPSHHDDELFLLSWTLTLSTHHVEYCHSEGISIIDLAELARPKLIPNLNELMMRTNQITKTLFPNILYVDAVEPFVGRAGMYMNYYYNYLRP